MDYSYVAYTEDRRLVRGKLSASGEETAATLLSYGGYQVVSLKPITPFIDKEKLAAVFTRIKPREIIMLSRQLALLLESGTDIVTSLELLQVQITNRTLKRVLGEIAAEIRGGSSLSTAMSKHPQVFSQMYHRAIAAGEQGGNLEIVLRQMADHLERGAITEKKIKGALTYPVIVAIVSVLVIGVLVRFVLPTFTNLYSQFGVELPLTTRILMGATEWLNHYGLYLLIVIAAAVGLGFAYVKTPAGRYQVDKLTLRLPIIGRLTMLDELSRCCRTMSLLYRVGLALPEIMSMAIHAAKNKVYGEALTEVQRELIRGEGLSKPMAKNPVFLPMMVQMVSVGEETGKLDNTLATVAESYETEADDLTNTAVALIQPAMIVIIAVFVGFIALSLVEAMYSIYGQVGY